MVLVSPAEFSYFLSKFGSNYPYKEISKTRRRFHVKWIITNKPIFRTGAIPRNIGYYTAIPSSSLDDDLVQYLIIHKKAQPVPAVMSIILDWMYCWGRGQDVSWYSQVVDWLHFLLYHGIQLSDKLVLRDCVEYRMRKLIVERGQDLNTIIPLFHEYFDEEYYEKGVKDFYELALRSINWFRNSFPGTPAIGTPNIILSSP
jgi:hypothetical protein